MLPMLPLRPRLFPPGEHPVDVFPEGGRIAMFLSKTVAHEVGVALKGLGVCWTGGTAYLF